MGFPALLRLKHKDIGALIVFCVIGWLIGSAISDPIWAAYIAFLVCDHLFVGWLVFLGDRRARHPIPIEAIVLIHVAFVVLVVVVVAARNSLHYFSLFPYPMTALALWLLSSAIGYEDDDPEAVDPRKHRSTEGSPEGQRLKRRAWTGPVIRARWFETASRSAQPEPAADAQVFPEPGGPEAVVAPQPASSSAPRQPAGARWPIKPRNQVLTVTESPIGYQPVVSGIPLNLQSSMNPAGPPQQPELYRDNSIAKELRRTYPEDVARIYPILVATAEDNEAWLDARGTENPTHRKLGLSVREEYEEWLEARVVARAEQDPAPQRSPVSSDFAAAARNGRNRSKPEAETRPSALGHPQGL
jgi:hypothetical protein